MSRSQLGLACAVVVALAVPLTGAAQNEGAHGHDAAPAVRAGVKLGTIRFPTSAKGAAQADFIEGVLYLHSFEYESARDAFRRAQRKSPAFALAYWGDAQSWNHPVWNQRNADSARAALVRLAPTAAERAARAPSAREKAWLNTVEVLYGDGPKPRRDSLYLRSMEALAQVSLYANRAEATKGLAAPDAAHRADAVVWFSTHGTFADEAILRRRLVDESPVVRELAEQGLWA